MKFFSALLGFLIFVAALVFALSNRQSIAVSLWPFDVDVLMPLYLIVLGSLALGALFGGGFIWIGTLQHRFLARRLGKDVVLLSDKLNELERELAQLRAAASSHAPLLTSSKWRFWEKF